MSNESHPARLGSGSVSRNRQPHCESPGNPENPTQTEEDQEKRRQAFPQSAARRTRVERTSIGWYVGIIYLFIYLFIALTSSFGGMDRVNQLRDSGREDLGDLDFFDQETLDLQTETVSSLKEEVESLKAQVKSLKRLALLNTFGSKREFTDFFADIW